MDLTLLLLRILLAALLYAFLGTLLIGLWRDVRRAAAGGGLPTLVPGRLVVVEAGDSGQEPGTSFALQGVTSLGRDTTNTFVLRDPFVSARHALLAWREGHWWLEDLESRNGTTLNGEAVNQATVVSAGDLVGIGRVVLRLEVNQ